MIGLVAQMWPNPEGRPSIFFEISDPFEALHYDFAVFMEVNKWWVEARKQAQEGPKTAGEKYAAAVRRMPSSVEARIQEKLKRQREKHLKPSES